MRLHLFTQLLIHMETKKRHDNNTEHHFGFIMLKVLLSQIISENILRRFAHDEQNIVYFQDLN